MMRERRARHDRRRALPGRSTASARAAWPTSTAPRTCSSAARSRSSSCTARFAEDEEFVERFRREASARRRPAAPERRAVYDRGEWDGTYYIAMEYVDGRTLKQIVREEAPLDPRARSTSSSRSCAPRASRTGAGSSTATSSRTT